MKIKKGKSMCFFSAKGGVGKTVNILNLAGILEQLDKKVLIIDFDLGTGGVAASLNKRIKMSVYDMGEDILNNRFTKVKDYVVLYKFHPLLGDIQCNGGVNMNKEDLYTLMQVSDCLISDYSSVIFDYSLLNKPMISYIPDVKEYKHNIGLNIDFDDFPGPVCTDEDQLVKALEFKNYDYDKLSYFQIKYMVYTDGKNTSRVIDTINQIMEEV